MNDAKEHIHKWGNSAHQAVRGSQGHEKKHYTFQRKML